jgi:FkbH-like protein
MHFITSNFNLLHSNKNWDYLKKKNIDVDEEYNAFYLKLNNSKILNKYDTFHILIYIDIDNIDENLKILKEINKNIFLRKKNFFLYIIIYNSNNLKNNNDILKKISKFTYELTLNKQNLYIKTLFELENKIFNNRNKLHIKFPFDISILKKFNKIIDKNIKIINSKPYKLIILDCDNTLWGGILDEDKIKGIIYGDDDKGIIFKQFQKQIKKLKHDGFLLSISSKNNDTNVWECMRNREMLLQKNDFLNPKINWNEKYLNIKKTLSELSLRASDAIFVDDNILEIQKVKKMVKGINCLHIDDPLNIKKKIENDLRFQKLLILDEDLKKYKQYKIRSKYNQLREKNINNSKFFIKLQQKIKFYDCSKINFERALQLFNKTNQFNFTLNRYKNNELEKITNKKIYDIKLFDLKDKYGNHGIIGTYIIIIKENSVQIEDFVLSCRVINRYVEDYIILSIVKKYKNKKITIKYLNTGLNNKIVPIFLKKNYFKLEKQKNNMYTYQIIFNKELDEIKKFFNQGN